MDIRLAARYAWAFPATAVGLAFAAPALCAGATIRFTEGAIEIAGGKIDRMVALLPAAARFAAITFGHVIIGADHAVLDRVRPHEHVHVRQYERWGVFFFPLYITSSLVQCIRGRDPYRDNWFEREAYRLERQPR